MFKTSTCGINDRPMALEKKLHKMMDVSVNETMRIGEEAGWISPEPELAIEKVSVAYEGCTRAGARHPSQKIYLRYIRKALNGKVQMYFTLTRAFSGILTVMHIADMGTELSETKVVHDRKGKIILDLIGKEWIYRIW